MAPSMARRSVPWKNASAPVVSESSISAASAPLRKPLAEVMTVH